MKTIFIIAVVMNSLVGFIKAQDIDIQGHRGLPSLFPENTIPGFLAALDTGVTTIEMDVVITKDQQVVVSHEPYFNSMICLDNKGNPLTKEQGKSHNIYQYNYDEVSKFDCGSLGNKKFASQQPLKLAKPLLSEVIKSVEKHIKNYTLFEVDYNIEIKSEKSTDNIYHPPPKAFSDLVFEVIDAYLPLSRVTIQSFDIRVLKYWHRQYPNVKLAALIKNIKSIDTNLANLGFKPEIYSPYYRLLNRKRVHNLHKRGLKVIPWTVNEEKTIRKLINWGVDGIITDYPQMALQICCPEGMISGSKNPMP